MKYRKEDFYETMNCKTILGKEAVKINDAKKEVLLDDGEVVNYDKLLVATGSLPFVPPMKGLEGVEKRFSFMSLDDAKELESAISPSSKVLIIGAGLIGLKCAEGISKRVESITVVDLADRILSSILDRDGAEIVKSHIEKKNINFILNAKVDEFTGNKALLSNGEEVEFDVLVVAVGVIPNTGLIKEINGKVNRGIAIDEFCQTSIPDIYAAGDCCESFDITLDQNSPCVTPKCLYAGRVCGS
ncbi:NAD(P)/FAD-dependent oxidoreductase [Acetivibrio straminisolvens]|uniref:Nitrite reductase n=1 Tax=Acetivibrio straminisolvens JCM 21531 TaxID=1294263 RepID=W4V2H9_9FIRM|nr:nitrite reductase [Acetivibrio straminisolvens JCM 21531]